jgi:hypothetical protein
MINPLGYKILTELPIVCQDTIVSSTSLPLSREVLSDYTKLVSKAFKLYTRQRLSQHICKLLICANHIGYLQIPSTPYHECSDTVFLCASIYHGTQGSPSSLYNFGYHIESWLLPSPYQIDLSTTLKSIWLHNWHNMQQCIIVIRSERNTRLLPTLP